jgi:hypothetical protein
MPIVTTQDRLRSAASANRPAHVLLFLAGTCFALSVGCGNSSGNAPRDGGLDGSLFDDGATTTQEDAFGVDAQIDVPFSSDAAKDVGSADVTATDASDAAEPQDATDSGWDAPVVDGMPAQQSGSDGAPDTALADAGFDASDDVTGTPCQVTGAASSTYQSVDSAILAFLQAQSVANAQFALSESGATRVTRAYTCPGAVGAPTDTSTVFRLASNSKAWTSAAIDILIQQGT